MGENQYDVQILDPAQAELEEIAELYRSLVGPDSARRVTDNIYGTLEQLSRFPLSGPPMRDHELRKLGYHFVAVDKYIVIYRFLQNTVVVYHIFDGRSDYPTLFRSEVFKLFQQEAAKYYKEDLKGVEIMCKAFQKTGNEAREQAYLDNIRNLMDSLKLSAEQAMAALKIPAEEQSKYLVNPHAEESAPR